MPPKDSTTAQAQAQARAAHLITALSGDTAPIPIGAIDGFAVTAQYSDTGELVDVALIWHGTKVSTDGATFINIGNSDPIGCDGDIPFERWPLTRQIVEAKVVERLIPLARSHRHHPALASFLEAVVTYRMANDYEALHRAA